jgi:hypothetical protein
MKKVLLIAIVVLIPVIVAGSIVPVPVAHDLTGVTAV